jgi:D-amino-acid dehydrogenase
MSGAGDVLIIGGGVIGVCAAYYLAERGARVTLVEQGDIAAGSSYGNAGLIVPSHSIPLATPGALKSGLRWILDPESPLYIKPRLNLDLLNWLLKFTAACRTEPMRRAIPVLRDLGAASVALYEELAEELGGLKYGYHRTGLLQIFKTPAGLAEAKEEAHLLNEMGVNVEVLDGDGLRALEPKIRPDILGGLRFPGDAHFTPAEFVQQLACCAERKGARLSTRTEVLGFEVQGRKITTVRTTRGDWHPDEVILAAGAWSPVVARDLRLNLPIQPAKGYSITVKRPANAPTMPLLLGETKVAVTPMISPDGPTLRFAGTLELAGLDMSITQRRVEAVRLAPREYLLEMEETPVVEVWRGLRPCTPDGLPILGRAPACENLIVAAGHAMVGMSLGPITGKLVAQLVCDESPSMDLKLLRAERFG